MASTQQPLQQTRGGRSQQELAKSQPQVPGTEMAPFSLFNDPFFGALFPRDVFGGLGSELVNAPKLNVGLLRTDIRENDKAIEIQADVPGVNKENVKVELDPNNMLHITVDNQAQSEDRGTSREGWTYHRMERSSMFGQRSVKLPANVDAAHIDARVENGVLLVTVPKTEPAASQRKRISVA